MWLKRHDHCFQPTEYSSKNYPMRYELNDIYLVTEDSATLFTINLSGCYNSFPSLSRSWHSCIWICNLYVFIQEWARPFLIHGTLQCAKKCLVVDIPCSQNYGHPQRRDLAVERYSDEGVCHCKSYSATMFS